jgi:fructose/tagatose bisphosphate aldolase
VDAVCNELGITVPVAIHADHYGIKGDHDVEAAKIEIPSMFEAGITSIAIDASHLPDDENLMASIALNPFVPLWAGYETEVGEIKGKEGLSTVDEALFLIQGLNAHDIFPDWIALNNGTTHGIQDAETGIQVPLTVQIHEALKKYKVSGAQHGTSGNDSERLRRIAQETNTTKANVATALQMLTWGVKVNAYGNAMLDEAGEFVKEPDKGMTSGLWAEMVTYAKEKGLKGGNYKKLNLRERMVRAVDDFVYELLSNVFNAKDTAALAIETIIDAGSHDLGPKVGRMEDPAEWTEAKIIERAAKISSEKGPAGDFED